MTAWHGLVGATLLAAMMATAWAATAWRTLRIAKYGIVEERDGVCWGRGDLMFRKGRCSIQGPGVFGGWAADDPQPFPRGPRGMVRCVARRPLRAL